MHSHLTRSINARLLLWVCREIERQAVDFKERVRRRAEQDMREFEAETKKNALGDSSRAYAEVSKALQHTRHEARAQSPSQYKDDK